MCEQPFDLAAERRRIRKIHDPDGAATDLVLTGRADAPPCRADAGERTCLFAQRVELLVQWQDQCRVIGDAQALRRDINALPLQAIDLFKERARVYHDTITNDRQLSG